MMGILTVFVGLIGVVGLGMAAVWLIFRVASGRAGSSQADIPLAERLGLAILLGLGLTSWLSLLWSLAGGPLGPVWSWSLTGLGWLAIVYLPRRWDRETVGSRRFPGSPLASIAQILMAVLFGNLLIQTLLTPQRLWDERAIYGIKAAVLFEEGSVRSATLRHVDFVQYHPRYPLLIPLAEQHVYALLGEVNDRWAKAVFPLMYLGLLLSFSGVLSRHIREGEAWLFAILLGTIPSLMPWEYGFLSGQADAPVASYHGLSLLYLWDGLQIRDRMRAFSLAGLAAGLALFTKDEGIALFLVDALALFLLLGITCHQRMRTAAREMGLFFLSVGLIAVPWLLHRRSLPTTTEMAYFSRMHIDTLASGIDALRWSLEHLWSRLFKEWKTWGLQWWGILISIVTAPKRLRSTAQALLLLDILGALAALIVAGMIAPTPVEEHLGGSSHRFLIQLTPAALLLMAGQWGTRNASHAGERSGNEPLPEAGSSS